MSEDKVIVDVGPECKDCEHREFFDGCDSRDYDKWYCNFFEFSFPVHKLEAMKACQECKDARGRYRKLISMIESFVTLLKFYENPLVDSEKYGRLVKNTMGAAEQLLREERGK